MSYLRGTAAKTLFLLAASAATAHADGFGPSRLWSASFSPTGETPLVGDFNGDGKDDAVSFVGDSKLDWRRGDVMVALSTGSAMAAPAKWHDFFCIGAEVPVVGDWNNDGKDDIGLFKRSAAGDQAGDVIIALSNGTSFGSPILAHPFFGLGDELPAVGDWNGDGRDDIAVFKRTSPGSQAGDVLVALSNGTSFGASQLWHTDFAFGAELPMVGDFDGDHDDDIVVFKRGAVGQVGQVRVALSSRAGFGATWVWQWWFAPGDEVPAVGDIDGDGRDDIVQFRRSTVGDVRMGDVEVARSNGWGWFESTYVWHDWFGIGNERPAMGDLDNDGRDDAIIFKQANAHVLVALDAAPSVLEPESRAAAFGYDVMRSEDGARARGARPLLTVLLDFSDQQFKAPHGQAYFRDMLFTGETDFHTISGMFREMSFGQFWFTDAGVLAPFRATDNPATPTVDESKRECAKGATNLCPGTTSTEAGLWANALRANAWSVDFARFDTNHNGMVTESELTIAFVNASDFGDGNGTSFRMGCVWVNGPSGGVNLCPWISTVAEGVSFATFAHELAHTIGAHDLYNSTNVMGQDATLMNNILTSGAPRASVELDAWHKMALGWVMPRIYDIAQPGSCDFLQVSLADEFFDAATWYERPILLYDSRRGGNEFFLLEYRLKDSWFNRYDADVQATGLSIWYVQQNGAHDAVYIPGLQIHAGNDGMLQSVAAYGSDDFVSGNSVWSGGDELWQSVRSGDDDYYWDRAVLQLPVGGRRGDTDIHVLGEGRFRARYLVPWEDAELAIETASIGNPQWLAVRWGHHALDVLPRVGNNDLFQYCHDRFPH